MSFSRKIKEELSGQLSPSRTGQVAESAALICMCGAVAIDKNGMYSLKIHTENLSVARKCFTLFRKTYNIKTDVAIRRNQKKGTISYYVIIKAHLDALRVLSEIHLLDPFGEIEEELYIEKNV